MGERAHYAPGTFCLWVWPRPTRHRRPASTRASSAGIPRSSAGEAGTYTILRRGGKEVAILYRQTPQARAAGASPHWTSYVSVEDADATAAQVGELGGAAVFRQSFDVLDAGRVAAIRDPTGAIVSLWQPRSLIGAALVNDVGAGVGTNSERRTSSAQRRSSASCSAGSTTPTSAATPIKNAGGLNGGMRVQTEPERGTPPEWPLLHGRERRRHRSASRTARWPIAPADHRCRSPALIEDPQGAAFVAFEGETDP